MTCKSLQTPKCDMKTVCMAVKSVCTSYRYPLVVSSDLTVNFTGIAFLRILPTFIFLSVCPSIYSSICPWDRHSVCYKRISSFFKAATAITKHSKFCFNSEFLIICLGTAFLSPHPHSLPLSLGFYLSLRLSSVSEGGLETQMC